MSGHAAYIDGDRIEWCNINAIACGNRTQKGNEMSEQTKGQGIDALKMLHTAWGAVQPWAQRNVTFGLVLAIVTEVPRWTFAFAAAHEPIWAGCALAALMSYAAAHAWEEYFIRHDRLLLTLNALSLAFGVFTISPVIFAMTNGSGHSVNMKDVLPLPLLWVWAIVLASTTFLPLIQVAVVEVRRRDRVQLDAQPEVQPKVKKVAQLTADIVQPTVQPVAPIVQIEEVDETSIVGDALLDGCPDQNDKPAYAKWLHMEKGMSQTSLGTMFGVHRNTVGKWLKDADKVAA
jgi:hypothetical protein